MRGLPGIAALDQLEPEALKLDLGRVALLMTFADLVFQFLDARAQPVNLALEALPMDILGFRVRPSPIGLDLTDLAEVQHERTRYRSDCPGDCRAEADQDFRHEYRRTVYRMHVSYPIIGRVLSGLTRKEAECIPCRWSDKAIGGQPVLGLESLHRCLGLGTEQSIGRPDAEPALKLDD